MSVDNNEKRVFHGDMNAGSMPIPIISGAYMGKGSESFN